MPTDFLPDARSLLRTHRFGHHFIYYPVTGSTNTIAQELASSVPDGTLIITDEQTRGRGRLGRRWFAPPGSALLMSLILHPPAPLAPIHLSALCSLAWRNALAEVGGLQAAIKWPNDLLLNGRKVAGLLTETVYNGSRLQAVITGMGVNVHQDKETLDAASTGTGGTPATSIDIEAGRWVSRIDLLVAFLAAAEYRYFALLQALETQGDAAPVALCHEWARHMETIGKHVRVRSNTTPDATLLAEGIAEGVDSNGALLVRDAAGQLHTVLAGDVTLR